MQSYLLTWALNQSPTKSTQIKFTENISFKNNIIKQPVVSLLRQRMEKIK